MVCDELHRILYYKCNPHRRNLEPATGEAVGQEDCHSSLKLLMGSSGWLKAKTALNFND